MSLFKDLLIVYIVNTQSDSLLVEVCYIIYFSIEFVVVDGIRYDKDGSIVYTIISYRLSN